MKLFLAVFVLVLAGCSTVSFNKVPTDSRQFNQTGLQWEHGLHN